MKSTRNRNTIGTLTLFEEAIKRGDKLIPIADGSLVVECAKKNTGQATSTQTFSKEVLAEIDSRLPLLIAYLDLAYSQNLSEHVLRSTWDFWSKYPRKNIHYFTLQDKDGARKKYAIWEIVSLEYDDEDPGLIHAGFLSTPLGVTDTNVIYAYCCYTDTAEKLVETKVVSPFWLEKNYTGSVSMLDNCVALGYTKEETACHVFKNSFKPNIDAMNLPTKIS